MKEPIIEKVKLSEIRPNPSNPRELSREKFDELVKSIKDFPKMLSAEPIKIADGVILSGNQRYQALKRLGHKEAYVQRLDHFTEEERLEYIIKANVHSGIWDWDMLANGNEWDEYQLNEWGLDVWQPEEDIKKGLTDPDEVPEVPEEAKTKLGDLYILGEHRVLCGDSTKAEDVEKLMNGEKADALVTDPPFGINANKQTLGSGKKQFHRGGDWDKARPEITALLGLASTQIIWGGNYFSDVLSPTNDWLCWHKKNDGLSFSEFELAWTNLGKNCRLLSHHWGGENKLHPTMKPVAVMEWCIDMTEGTILDPFLGSGSTLIAAEKTNRKCYGMELDPKYCDVIVKRWEDFTGKKAQKV
tara:strand:+ start:94 stop:1167 length:1074 start_codon:yes stop_codon:yes gene_type:complete